MPASLSNRLPFRPLQRRQAITWFSQLLAAPPRDVGTTWSTESWAEGIPLPQYWQVPSSRGRRLRRVAPGGGGGGWGVGKGPTQTKHPPQDKHGPSLSAAPH